MIGLADRVRETTTTTGTGTYDLGGAETGFITFVAGRGDGEEATYCCTDGTDFEVGVGTITDAAPDTLSRDTIIASSNGGAAVNWGAGDKDIFLTASAETLPHWGETVELSSDSEIDFDISGCEMVELTGFVLPATDGNGLYFRFSNDGGSSFRTGAADYSWLFWEATSGSHGPGADPDHTVIALAGDVGSGASEGLWLNVVVTSCNDSNAYTVITGTVTGVTAAGDIFLHTVTGRVLTKEVNDAIRLYSDGGNLSDGRLTVYRYPAVF